MLTGLLTDLAFVRLKVGTFGDILAFTCKVASQDSCIKALCRAAYIEDRERYKTRLDALV